MIKELSNYVVGIYILYEGDVCMYVGSSINIRIRLATHKRDGKIRFNRAQIFECYVKDLQMYERHYIKKYKPLLNKATPGENRVNSDDYLDVRMRCDLGDLGIFRKLKVLLGFSPKTPNEDIIRRALVHYAQVMNVDMNEPFVIDFRLTKSQASCKRFIEP